MSGHEVLWVTSTPLTKTRQRAWAHPVHCRFTRTAWTPFLPVTIRRPPRLLYAPMPPHWAITLSRNHWHLAANRAVLSSIPSA